MKKIMWGFVICLGLWGCSPRTQTESQIPLSDITQAQLNDLLFGVDYGLLINQSLEGDTKSLVKLMTLGKQTDGGGAYGFGVMLQAIALEIGDPAFAEATKKLSKTDRQRTHILLSAGFDYGDRRYTVADFEKVLPETFMVTKMEPNNS